MNETQPLGAFSVSLAVQDLRASEAFYNRVGFATAGGDAEQGWLIMRNGSTVIGLFKGMFEKNMLTFNPRWNEQAEPEEDYPDIRVILGQLRAQGLEPLHVSDESGSGPAHFVIEDPDGNQLFFDQHV